VGGAEGVEGKAEGGGCLGREGSVGEGGGREAGWGDEGGCGHWGGGARNSVDSDRGEGLGYGGGDPEELGVLARRIWEGEHWRHREGPERSSQKARTYGTSDHL
jgi:hypothetical protein